MFFKTPFPNNRPTSRVSICNAYKAILCLCLMCFGTAVFAQKTDTANKTQVRILRNKLVTYYKTDSGEYFWFTGDVAMQQGTDTLYCDSLHENSTTHVFEAFSNVRIAQTDGTQATSDYMKYTSQTKMAFMQGNVILTDVKNRLKCQELTYNLDTKTGVYDKGGTLSNDTTTITSNAGIYDVREKKTHFTGHVVITDPKYNIKSEDMVYNTETKVTEFYAKSIVTSDSGRSVLETKSGTYDGKNVIAHFTGRSSIWNDGQYMQADSGMHYNKLTGYGFADGHVISIDTQHHSTLYCGHAEYFRKKGVLWATIKPVLEQVNGKDTLYMRSDTFYSAHMARVAINKAGHIAKAKTDSIKTDSTATGKYTIKQNTRVDTLTNGTTPHLSAPYITYDTVWTNAAKQNKIADSAWVVPEFKYRLPDFRYDTVKTIAELYKKSNRKKAKEENTHTIIPDTSYADSTAPVYFVGYRHVKIFSDSLQGKCDSVCYTRSDSVIRMIGIPIVWAHNSQITGDTILMHLDSSTIKSLYVPNNAFLVSQSGPAGAKLFDQVQGKTLTAYFTKNEITRMIVFPNAESIYYSKDEKGAYMGMNQSQSARMRIYFENQKITNIKFGAGPPPTP